MAENSNIGGSGSRQVGAVHIDMTLKGAEQVKAGAQDVAKTVQGSLVPALNSADEATKKVAESSEKAASGFDAGGRGMLRMAVAVGVARKAMTELADILETIRASSESGGDAASKLFSEQGLAGAESRMKAIADQAERMSSKLANASDALRNLATLNVSGFVEMFNAPAKLMEEQNRLSVLSGKQLRADREKEREKDKEAEAQRRAEQTYARLMDEIAEDERIKKEEEAYNRQLQREREAEADALEKYQQRGREMAKAFAAELDKQMKTITSNIQSGIFGANNVGGGDVSQVVDALGRIERKIQN